MPTKRRHRQRTPHYDRRRRVVKLGGGLWWQAAGVVPWAAYAPVQASSFADSLIDLTGQGNDAGDPGGAATPPWNVANGWMPDGIADYLTTTFVPQNDQSQSILIQFTNLIGINDMLLGMSDGANRRMRIQPANAGTHVRYDNGATIVALPILAAGNLGIAGARAYRNGVDEGAAIPAWVGAAVSPLYIGCWNNVGVPGSFVAAFIRAVIIYDVVLTAPQMLAIVTAMTVL